MFSFKYHVLCKFKHLSSIEQYPSSTSSLICRRVLPPGISRLSWNCIISYEFFIKYYILTDYNFSWARSYWTLKDTDNWTESALRFNNSSVSFYKYEFVPDHAIPRLFGYIIVVTILTVLPGPYSRSSNFRRWTNLMSILIVISFRLEQQAWFRVCVVPLVPITFHFIITWLDVVTDRLHLHELSRQRCRDHQHSELIQDINWIHDEKYHPCPRWIVLSSTTLLPSHQHKLVHVWCYTLSSLLSSNCSSLPWSITILYVKNVLRFVPPLENSWHRNTSHHHHSFLVPVLIPTSERCCLDSFLLATLSLWS